MSSNRIHVNRFAATLCLVAGVGAAADPSAGAPEAWPRTTGLKPAQDAAVPPGSSCSASLTLEVDVAVMVCRDPGQGGASLWAARSSSAAATPSFSRVIRWPGTAGARLSWHRAPDCPANTPCIRGVVLADTFDDYCMGTTVITLDAARHLDVTGRIPELIEVEGEPQCIGAAAILSGTAQRVDIQVAGPLLRQTAAGTYLPVSPPANYRIAKGRLLRERR